MGCRVTKCLEQRFTRLEESDAYEWNYEKTKCKKNRSVLSWTDLLYFAIYIAVSKTWEDHRIIQCVHKVHSGFWKIVARKQIELAVGVTIHAKLDVWIL
jgi:hypothetical protein